MGQFPWKKAPGLLLGITLCFQIAADSPQEESPTKPPSPVPEPSSALTQHTLAQHTLAQRPESQPWSQEVNTRLAFYAAKRRLPPFSPAVESSCVPLHILRDALFSSDGPQLYAQMNPKQKMFLELVYEVWRTPIGGTMLKNSQLMDTVLCMDPALLDGGSFGSGVVFLRTQNIPYGQDRVSPPAGKVFEAFGPALRAVSEELTHSYQEKILHINFPEKSLYPPDVMLWDFAAEAHAKVITAVILIQEAIRTGKQDDLLDVSWGESKDTKLLRSVMEIFQAHGADEITKNPALLRPAFLSFFESKDFITGYFSAYSKCYQNLKGTQRIPFGTFVNAFGTFPGSAGNIFDGWDGKRSMDALADRIPPETLAKKWVAEKQGLLSLGEETHSQPQAPSEIPALSHQ